MDRIVTYLVAGHELQTTVSNAATDDEARAKIIAEVSRTFQIRAITPIRTKPSFIEGIVQGITSSLSLR